jgi:CrcB protein
MSWAAVAIGGALGSMARYGVHVWVEARVNRPAPFATAIVNVIGCVVIGALAGLIASGRIQASETMRVFVFVGLLGGFTTFSSFGLDTFALARDGAFSTACWNVAGQVGLGLLAVAGGFRIGSA